MGGKSRKSGGVSKSLIAAIKAGSKNTGKSNCGTKKIPNGHPQKSLFDEADTDEDDT
jgi:hypothetical protein